MDEDVDGDESWYGKTLLPDLAVLRFTLLPPGQVDR